MNQFSIFTLKTLQRLYSKAFHFQALSKPICEKDPKIASRLIYYKLLENKPCMIARFGSSELNIVVNYLGVKEQNKNILKFIKGEIPEWWWNIKTVNILQSNAGFFPLTKKNIEQYCELMLEDMKELDILGSWQSNEKYVNDRFNAAKVHLQLLEPFWSSNPWTKALEGTKVLVVHPFDSLIESQYKYCRKQLFKDKNILPEFELQTLKAVQSLGGTSNGFSNWFEALQWMKDEIDKRDYDFCLIGAGAYGFPLASHVKRQGKKAIHLGGALQLLFGIKGKRWEDPSYGVKKWNIPVGSYSNLMNDYWKRPGEEFKPANAESIEGACYW